jgi:hypothetical protein
MQAITSGLSAFDLTNCRNNSSKHSEILFSSNEWIFNLFFLGCYCLFFSSFL